MAKRNPENNRKTEVVSVRITVEEKEALMELAVSKNMKLPDFIRHLLMKGIYQ
jgi:hypothetical protein